MPLLRTNFGVEPQFYKEVFHPLVVKEAKNILKKEISVSNFGVWR